MLLSSLYAAAELQQLERIREADSERETKRETPQGI